MINRKDLPVLMSAPVVVAALGYFVDIYDLILFSIVRVSSLRSLGVSDVLGQGVFLLNMQMFGMLTGGVLWGVLGDKRGRLSVLFGSIITYSIANILNGFVQNVEQYALLRFVAGVGLAGELGAGITLVSESLPQRLRGYGTAIVATVGVSGAIVGGLIGDRFDWRVAYFIGGGLGMLLLILRASVFESGLYMALVAPSRKSTHRGKISDLFKTRERFGRYLRCIAIGVPIWFVLGVLITFSPEFASSLGVVGSVTSGKAVMYCYLGFVFGDFASGFLSQWYKTRKKIVAVFLGLTALFILAYLNIPTLSVEHFYSECFLLGFGGGYWAVFVTIAAEQFGTNLRATVTTSVPNFVRGATVPMTSAFLYFQSSLGVLGSGLLVGCIALAIAAFALMGLRETHGRDLDFTEGA